MESRFGNDKIPGSGKFRLLTDSPLDQVLIWLHESYVFLSGRSYQMYWCKQSNLVCVFQRPGRQPCRS